MTPEEVGSRVAYLLGCTGGAQKRKNVVGIQTTFFVREEVVDWSARAFGVPRARPAQSLLRRNRARQIEAECSNETRGCSSSPFSPLKSRAMPSRVNPKFHRVFRCGAASKFHRVLRCGAALMGHPELLAILAPLAILLAFWEPTQRVRSARGQDSDLAGSEPAFARAPLHAVKRGASFEHVHAGAFGNGH